MHHFDAVDSLHGFNGFADNGFKPLNELGTQAARAGVFGKKVFGLVAESVGLGADGREKTLGLAVFFGHDPRHLRLAGGALDLAAGFDGFLGSHGVGQLITHVNTHLGFVGGLSEDRDFGFELEQLHRLPACDLELPQCLLALDADAVSLFLGLDPGALGFFAGRQFGLVNFEPHRDPVGLRSLLGGDARLRGGRFLSDARLGNLGGLLGAAQLDFLFLHEAGQFGLAVERQRFPLRLQVALADRDNGLLLDIVAQLAAVFHDAD